MQEDSEQPQQVVGHIGRSILMLQSPHADVRRAQTPRVQQLSVRASHVLIQRQRRDVTGQQQLDT